MSVAKVWKAPSWLFRDDGRRPWQGAATAPAKSYREELLDDLRDRLQSSDDDDEYADDDLTWLEGYDTPTLGWMLHHLEND